MPPKKAVGQAKGRPAFVGKLWQMVNDPENDPYIRWMPDGKSIQVVNREQFEKTLLPKYFKHANFSSFVRQLNMYGWHKVQDLSSGSMHNGDENWQFQSPNFIKGHEELLDRIVRNKGNPKQENEDEEQDLGRVLRELEAIKSKQMVIGEDLFRIRKDNELLWNEFNQSRDKYDQHSQLLDKILHFLASVYGQNGGKILDSMMGGPTPGTKRRFITQAADSPLSDGSERIQEINEMKDLQDKIKEGSADTPIDLDLLKGGSALVPFSRPMASYPHGAHGHVPGASGIAPGSSAHGAPGAHAPGSSKQIQRQPEHVLDQISSNQADIDNLANQMAMQDLSLQQVQDWIQKMNPEASDLDGAPEVPVGGPVPGSSAAVNPLPVGSGDVDAFMHDPLDLDTLEPMADTPINFDVNDFLNSDLEEPVIKEEI